MNVRILSCAEREFADAVDFYKGQWPGLGYELAAEVKATLDRVRTFPDAWPSFSHHTRRCLLGRFPYGVVYRHGEDGITVLAIQDLRRDPERWEGRLQEPRA